MALGEGPRNGVARRFAVHAGTSRPCRSGPDDLDPREPQTLSWACPQGQLCAGDILENNRLRGGTARGRRRHDGHGVLRTWPSDWSNMMTSQAGEELAMAMILANRLNGRSSERGEATMRSILTLTIFALTLLLVSCSVSGGGGLTGPIVCTGSVQQNNLECH